MRSPLERTVRDLHATLSAQHPEFCACEQCTDDIIVMVMNKTRPRFTTTGLGWAVEAAALETDQARAELSVLVFDAMRRVAQQPRHASTESGSPKARGGSSGS